jgi:hypothetical protein
MERTTNDGHGMGHGERLEEVQDRFLRWRATRVRGERIPGVLWAAAAELARVHGVQRIAHKLRVDPAGLTRRLDRAGNTTQEVKAEPRFVELLMPAAAASVRVCECVVELANERGASMRVELNGAGLAGLPSLCAAFWSAS